VLVVLFLAWRRRGASGALTRVSAIASDLPAEGTVLVGGGAITDGRVPALASAGTEQDAAADPDVRAKRERMRSELTAFVDSQPDEIAQLVQSWLAERKS
jgi:flagellar M-ring protein FliF